MAEETNHNQAGEVAPSTVDKQAPSVAEEHAPSTDSPATTDIPTANAPDPKAAKTAATPAKADKAAAAKPKKEKAPAVEDKPFVEFMQQDYMPALKKALEAQGAKELALNFEKQKVPIKGFEQIGDCWQIVGSLQKGQRQFNLYFPDEDIQGKKAFSCNEGPKPSTLESFLIDERKITLDLLVFGVTQRLNGQKWLALN